ncbi:DNA primase [Candidatus Wolfebacteria bacterium]|nr:DNA primase [Candidatus Wolfebacteria bacterium]
MSDSTQLIKEKLDIVDFIKKYVELKPAGKNFKGVCPFHKEKTPSFMVSPERQSWHCFGSCGEGGDIIKFLMKYENIEFFDALKILAEKTGVELKNSNSDFKSYNNLYNVMNEAKEFFKKNLFQSRVALDYLKERGLKEETVRIFELGLASDNPDILTRHLLSKGFKIEEIEKAGLNIKTERGTYWDRFRSRLMFPIHNHLGKTVAFTGRIMPGNEHLKVGKYVNSPETPIFRKSKVLYGFFNTKNDIRDTNTAVLVEGQMDFLMMWQDGVKNVVATSGTALTEEHLKALRRFADELILSFDSDEAGQKAAERAIDLAGANDFSVKLLVLEDENTKDPADMVKDNPGKIKEMLQGAKSARDYYFYKYITKTADDPKTKKQNIRIILTKIKNLSSAIDRDDWLKALSKLAKIDENVLSEEMDRISITRPKEIRDVDLNIPSEGLSRLDVVIQRLFGVLLYRDKLDKAKDYVKYFPARYAKVYENLLSHKKGQVSDGLAETMDMINLRFSFENQDLDDSKIDKEIDLLLKESKKEGIKERQRQMMKSIEILEDGEDEKELEKIKKNYRSLTEELNNI